MDNLAAVGGSAAGESRELGDLSVGRAGTQSFEEFDRMLSKDLGLQESPRHADAFDLEFAATELANRSRQLDTELAGADSQNGWSVARRSVFQRKRRTSPALDGAGDIAPPEEIPAQASQATTSALAAKPPKPRAVSKPRRIKKGSAQSTVPVSAPTPEREPEREREREREPEPEPELEPELNPAHTWSPSSDPVFSELASLIGDAGQKLDVDTSPIAGAEETAQDDPKNWSPGAQGDAPKTSHDADKPGDAVEDDEPLFTRVSSTRWQQKYAGPRLEPNEDAVLLVTLVQCSGLTFPPSEDELEDIYATLQFGTQPMERSTIKFLMREPVYRETFRFSVTKNLTVDAEAVLTIDVRGCSNSGLDLSIGKATLDLCEVFATASGEEATDWAGQSIEQEWPITRSVDGDSMASGHVRLTVKARGIGAPSRYTATSVPSPVAIGSGDKQNEQEGNEADLQALANAFEASTLGLSAPGGVQPEEDGAKPDRTSSARRRSKSAQRVRIDESMNTINSPREGRPPPSSRRAYSASQSGSRLSSPQRGKGAGTPKKPSTSTGKFHAGGHAVLATNTKYMTSALSPRKAREQQRRVDPTAVGDRLSSQRPKRHFDEAAHVLAGEHASQWTKRLGSPTRQERVQSPDRGRSTSRVRTGCFDVDQLRQELRELKLMALHDRAKRSKVPNSEIDKALEGDKPKATLVECILQVEADKAGVSLTKASGRKKKNVQGATAGRLGSPPRGRSGAQQRLGSPSRGLGSNSPSFRASKALRSPARKLSAKNAAAARRLSSPTRSSDRRNIETMNQSTVRRLNSPDRAGRLTSPRRASRMSSPEPVAAAAQLEAKRRDAATARRVQARRMASPPARRAAPPSVDNRARSARPASPGLEPWLGTETYDAHDSPPAAASDAAARWKKAGRAMGKAAVTYQRMEPMRISESEASELVAGLSIEQDEHGCTRTMPQVVKGVRALVLTARASRANVDVLISMGAVEPIVDLLSCKEIEAQECACLALVALSESDEGCTVAAELGALPRLLAISSKAAGALDKRAVHPATAALAALARLSANGEELAELRVTELLSELCAALERGTDAQSRVAADTALKIVRLCREGLGYQESGPQGNSVRRAVGELGGISLFVSLLGSNTAPVQLPALDGLKELCKLDSNRIKILETDGVGLLVSLSRAGSSSSVQRRAKSTLDVFCESAICRERAGELQVRSIASELRVPGHAESFVRTLRELSALCRESQLNRLAAIKANALLDAVRLLVSPSIGLQRAAVDLLKELVREEGAAETAGELGAIEPLMSLMSTATAKNDSGMQRATSKCLQLLQCAGPNKERLARLRVSTLVGKLKLAAHQGLSQHPEDGLMDGEALCDHAKSIAQLCKDDHLNIARFGELGALPRLVTLLGAGHGPKIERALLSALRELGWDEENRLEIAELKMGPIVRQLEKLLGALHGGGQSPVGVDVAEIAAVVTRICDECTDDDNRTALNTCGGLEALVELMLSDLGGEAHIALNALMNELARSDVDLKERIMQLLFDARARAAEADAASASQAGQNSRSIQSGPLQGSAVEGSTVVNSGATVASGSGGGSVTKLSHDVHENAQRQHEAAEANVVTADLAAWLQERDLMHRAHVIADSLKVSGERTEDWVATLDSMESGSETMFNDFMQAVEKKYQEDPTKYGGKPDQSKTNGLSRGTGAVTVNRGGGGGDSGLRQREKKALEERLREVEEDLSGAHRRRVQLEQQSAMLLERNTTLESEARAREQQALVVAQNDVKLELERTQVEIKVKDKVLEQQQREIHALKRKLQKQASSTTAHTRASHNVGEIPAQHDAAMAVEAAEPVVDAEPELETEQSEGSISRQISGSLGLGTPDWIDRRRAKMDSQGKPDEEDWEPVR